MQNFIKQIEQQISALGEPARRRLNAVTLAVAVGVAYFLAARLSVALLTKPDGVAVFWPAAGVAAGVMIALGPSAWLPVAAGAMAAIQRNMILPNDNTFRRSICVDACAAFSCG